jgi:serine protease
VGSTDSSVHDVTTERKSTFSDAGPAVHVWAPGQNILSATSTINKWGANSATYYRDAAYAQTLLSGTSMGAPQVAGILSTYLQINPNATPTQVKNWVLNKSRTTMFSTGLDSDYTNSRSLLGGTNAHVFWPFNLTQPLTFNNQVQLNNLVI